MSTEYDYYPTDWYFSFKRESTFRNADAQITTGVKLFDVFETVDLTGPQFEWEKRWEGGSRNVTRHVGLGAPPSDESFEGDAAQGYFWHYALGKTTTTTGAVYNTHVITEGTYAADSFSLHYQHTNQNTANSIYKDFLGCLMTNFTFTLAEGAGARHSYGLLISKPITGTDVNKPSVLTDRVFQWSDIESITLTYDSTDVFVTDVREICDNIEISCDNDFEVKRPGGDKYGKHPLVGTREYTIKMDIYPQNNKLRDLMETEIEDYATDLAFTYKVARHTTSDYIEFTFNKLRVMSYPVSITAVTDKQFKVSVEFEMAPTGTCQVIVVDGYDDTYYET